MRKFSMYESGRVRQIPIVSILPNPRQPRAIFEEAPLRELAASIKCHGILQPLTVRRLGTRAGFELISGERRLRAARLAGLAEVPCIIVGATEQQSSVLALVENIQRRDLDFIEQARGMRELAAEYGMTQDEIARTLGKSQSAVANKLRILKHPPEVLELIREGSLTERHARALLRLEGEDARISAAKTVVRRRLNVAETEELVERLLTPAETEDENAPRRRTYVIKDVRLFMNTVRHAVSVMRQAGVDADMGEREEEDGAILLTIRIPKPAENEAVSRETCV